MREWFGNLRDTMADAVYDITEPFMRCASTNEGKQCVNDKGHGGVHEDGEGGTW